MNQHFSVGWWPSLTPCLLLDPAWRSRTLWSFQNRSFRIPLFTRQAVNPRCRRANATDAALRIVLALFADIGTNTSGSR